MRAVLAGLAVLAVVSALGGAAHAGVGPEAAMLVAAEDGGYPWADATEVNRENYDWGYAKCPSSAPNCKTKVVKGKDGVKYGVYDPWNYYFRNCTSWVAWRLSLNGYSMPMAGHAKNWDDYFRGDVPVNSTPAVGAIAQTDAGTFGHVAYVEAVSKDGRSVTVSDYNKAGTGRYDRRTEAASKYTYIHVKDTAASDTKAPTTPSGLAVSAVKRDSLTLSWKASSDNVGVHRYWVYLNGEQVGSVTATKHTFGGLRCGTRYTLGVKALDAAGNKSPPVSTRATTAACPKPARPPSPPTGLVASSPTGSSLTFSWAGSSGATGYRVFLDDVALGTTTETRYAVASLACGRSYKLGVEAYNAAGASSRPSILASTASCSGTGTKPAAPTGLSASGAAAATSLRLAWSAAGGASGYYVYLDDTRVATTAGTSHTFAGLACGRAYRLGVEAYNSAGTSARAAVTAATSACGGTTPPPDTTRPSTPSGLSVPGASATATSLLFTWTASTDNVRVTGYSVYLNDAKVATTTATSYTFTGLACDRSYRLGVEAFDAAGNVSGRAAVTVSTKDCPPPPPSITLARGPAAPSGYWYAITLNNFPRNASITVRCHDSVDRAGFRTFTMVTNSSGHAFTQTNCYSGDGPDHWVTANGIESNRVRW